MKKTNIEIINDWLLTIMVGSWVFGACWYASSVLESIKV